MTTNSNPFAPATKAKAKLRLALAGISGAGKTYSALTLATAIADADGSKVAVLDTENGSASKYAHLFTFDTISLRDSYKPDRFMEMIAAAEQYGYGVLVIDSLSAAWEGEGGLLAMHDAATRRMNNDSFRAWAEITPVFKKLMRAILNSKLHMICTLQVTAEYTTEERQTNSGSKKTMRQVGTKPVMKTGFEYYFDIIGTLDNADLLITKTRDPALEGELIQKPSRPLAVRILDWLNAGVEPPPAEEEPDREPERMAPPQPVIRPVAQTRPAMPEASAIPPTERNADIARFWAQAKEAGFTSKKAVHEALGLEVRDGALAEWIADGHSYGEAFQALKLGIPIAHPEPPSVDAQQAGLGLDAATERPLAARGA